MINIGESGQFGYFKLFVSRRMSSIYFLREDYLGIISSTEL